MNDTSMTVGATAQWPRRRVVVAGAGAVALLLAFSSVAYACTILQGTYTVCRPASASYSATDCAQRTSTGVQVGAVTFDDGGSTISVLATGFSSSPTVYSITFAPVAPNCHAYNVSAGVTSLLGLDSSGNPNTVGGPSFSVGIGTGSTGGYNTVTTPAVSVGSYRVCAQDEPQRVDGNAVTGAVTLLL